MNVSWSSEKRSLWIIVSKEVFKENFERQVACLQITAFLHSFSLRTISLYQLSLSPQFPFSLHFTASSILSPFEKSVGIPDGQIQCFQSLVHYNIFRIILSFLDFMPPLVSGQQYTCEKCLHFWVLRISPYILMFPRVQSSALLYFCSL